MIMNFNVTLIAQLSKSQQNLMFIHKNITGHDFENKESSTFKFN